MGNDHAQAQALAKFANELRDLGARYRNLEGRHIVNDADFRRAAALTLGILTNLDPNLQGDGDLAPRLAAYVDGDLADYLARHLAQYIARDRKPGHPLDHICIVLDAAAGAVRRLSEEYGTGAAGLTLIGKTEACLVGWLARLLPAPERERFVAEARGNLGDCERWWQRVDYLVGVAIGTPRLAVMMRGEGRRRRA